jgi:hypothetical protein
MKTDRASLLWGTIIAIALIAAIMVIPSEFPKVRLPASDSQSEMFLVSAGIFGILIASYRKLWKRLGFWGLLLALLGAHIALYWLLAAKVVHEIGGIQKDILYGAISGAEFVVFSVAVAILYHRGPDTGFLIGRRVR